MRLSASACSHRVYSHSTPTVVLTLNPKPTSPCTNPCPEAQLYRFTTLSPAPCQTLGCTLTSPVPHPHPPLLLNPPTPACLPYAPSSPCRTWLANLGSAQSTAVSPEHPPLVIPPSTQLFIYDLFDRFVDPALAHIRKHCQEAIPSVDINLVTSTAMLFQVGASNLYWLLIKMPSIYAAL